MNGGDLQAAPVGCQAPVQASWQGRRIPAAWAAAQDQDSVTVPDAAACFGQYHPLTGRLMHGVSQPLRGGKPREVARRVAERVPGLGVKEAYELLKR